VTPKPTWTPAQLRGIQTTGRSLLVSAAAGSGKTAVLAARCAHLVVDAAPPCDVDQLLVVTFTEAAAAEMKGRIERVLREKLNQKNAEDDPRLLRQLSLIERAHVSTLHGFCSRLLRQNFHLLGLDPSFTMLDGDEGKLLRIEVARDLLADRYENDPEGHFGQLVRFHANGDDELLIPHVIRTHEMLCSLVDPDTWVQRARERITSATANLEHSEPGKELLTLLSGKLQALRLRCADAVYAVSQLEGLGKYVDYLSELALMIDDWSDRLRIHGLDSLAAAIKAFEAPRLPSIKNDVPAKSIGQPLVESIKEEMTRKGSLAQIARFSRAQWQAGLQSIAPLATTFLDLVDEFARRYRRAKDETRRLDFNDLERFALKILRDPAHTGGTLKPSGVARTYHKQFHHVLVDEYQDINEVQDAILHLVSRECCAGDPDAVQNLFAVGDVKQSIYRFRLAEPTRFLDRYARFKPHPPSPGTPGEGGGGGLSPGEVIDLQANFRSRGPLLNVLNQVFARLMTAQATDIEYDASHYLHPGATFPPADLSTFPGAPLELHLLPEEVPLTGETEDEEPLDRSEREAAFVARRIRTLMGTDDPATRMQVAEKSPAGPILRPIEYRDIVILLRSMKFKADQYADALRAAGVPVFREGGQGYFQSMEVRDMRALLTLLDNPQQDIPLAAVLRSPLAGLADPEDCLARIRLAYPNQSAIRNPQSAIPFHRAVPLYAKEHDDELAARLRDLLDSLHHWRQLARHRPLAELIWTVYDETGYLAFCEGLPNGQQRVANLLHLHERATQFGNFARQGLYRFLKFLDSLEAETDLGQPSVLSEAADVVRIMSVHHSKGLEFPVVFLPELGKKINLQDCYGPILLDKRAGLALAAVDEQKRIRYPSLSTILVEQSLKRQSLAEELRVLYVAMTRAKEHLILSGTCSDKRCEQWATRWQSHAGPMPADDVLAATTMLDWLGPVVSMLGDTAAFQVTPHSPEEVATWTGADLKRPTLTPLQEKIAKLEPLTPPPPADHRATKLIDFLTQPYPHKAASHQEAARSVTDWTKSPATSSELGTRNSEHSPFTPTLSTPRALLEKNQLSATDIGTATHTVLQHLDFTRPCTEDDLADQINALVTRRLLTPTQAKRLDLPAIEWFMSTDLAHLLRSHHHLLRRELDFYLAVDPSVPSTDALDQIMIRGRVDATLITPEGLTLIDYKTDRLTPDQLPARTALYQPQVTLYRRALEQITRRPVTGVHLVFLTPRQIVRL
jgi:ATP-dependent helicase/nuclease subunit A